MRPMPDFVSPETIAKIRAGVSTLPEFEVFDYDGIEGDLWKGKCSRTDWRESNLPQKGEAGTPPFNETCMLCGQKMTGWAVRWGSPDFRMPNGDGFMWWEDVFIHLDAEACDG